jgi:hypothetical protein
MRRLSYANVVATLALFVALGGSAAAAVIVSSNSEIAPNTIYGANLPAGKNDNIVGGSVGSSDLASSSVVNSKLATGAVGSGKLADKAVIAGKIADAAVAQSNLANGAVGTAKLASGAVTLPKLGSDVIDRIDSHTGTASPFTGTVPVGTLGVIVRTVGGVEISVDCLANDQAVITFRRTATSSVNALELFGIEANEFGVNSVTVTGVAAFSNNGRALNFVVIGRNVDVGKLVRMDVHAHASSAGCPYAGMTQVAG